MNKVNIVCVGKIKEKFYTDAVNEYAKRISRFAKLNIIEFMINRAWTMTFSNINKLSKHIKFNLYSN